MPRIVGEVPVMVDPTHYTLALMPVDPAQVALFQDGVRLRRTVHYNIAGQAITYIVAPEVGADLLADYDWGTVTANGDLTTLTNVKQYLGINNANSDGVLARLIAAQSEWFKNQVQRRIIRQAYTELFNGQDERVAAKSYMSPWIAGALYGGFFVGARGYAITLNQFPVLAINHLYIDGGDGNGNIGVSVPQATNLGQLTQTDGWVLHDNGQLELLGFRFTVGVNNCEVNYDAGWDAVPFDIEQAAIELVAWRFKEREHIGQSSRGVGGEQVTFSPYAAPMSVQAVIDNYRQVRV